ncbi:MAG: hypothetical protein QXV14_00030 [Candidatus Caldarchaeum sp.]
MTMLHGVELSLKTRKHYILSLAVFLLSLAFYLPPALVNEAPFWDDKAYINNALIASGRIEPSQARGPYAEERPPLFWWLLALLYTAGLPVETARLISPLTVSAGVVAVFLLTSKIFKSFLTGFLTALMLVVHDYFVLTTSYILTDSLGSILAFLALASFSLGLRYGPYMWLSGILMSVAILARDQNLLLIPVLALFLIWVAKTSRLLKVLALVLLGLTAYLAVSLTQEVFLQYLSDIATVVLLDRVFPVFITFVALFATLAVYKIAEQKNLVSRRPSIEERFFDILLAVVLCIIVLYPYFLDNVRLGDEYQIAGRGVLSRPVAHSIMVRNDIARTGLGAFERASVWASTTPQLLTTPILALSLLGGVLVLKNRVVEARPLVIWGGVSIPYVFFFTHFEYRFLAQAVPALACLTAYSLTRLTAVNKPAGLAAACLTLVVAAFPAGAYGFLLSFSTPTVLVGWQALTGASSVSERWLSDYVEYLDEVMKQPQPTIPLPNTLAALLIIPALAFAVYLGLRKGLEH